MQIKAKKTVNWQGVDLNWLEQLEHIKECRAQFSIEPNYNGGGPSSLIYIINKERFIMDYYWIVKLVNKFKAKYENL